MGPFIITLVVFILLSAYLIAAFISNIVHLLVNIPVLWVVLLRSYYEVRHKRIIYPYLAAVGITTLIFIPWFDKIQVKYVFWPVLFMIIAFIIAELINLGYYLYNKYEIKDKIRSFSS